MQPQWSTGQDGVDLPGVAGDGFGTLGGRRGQYQVEALMFEDRQVIIDGFNQYQNGRGHAWLLWASNIGLERRLRLLAPRRFGNDQSQAFLEPRYTV
ncbi:hypothetical protein D3C73_811580 [compost metagenome]